MRSIVALAFIALALTPLSVAAQSAHPYAGLQTRAIKALSDDQIADLKAGRGMSLALAAELNGYPGPLHVIELAEQLGLSEAQRRKVDELFAAMKGETIPLGERLIAQESELDGQFAAKTVTQASLESTLQQIGATQASLRAAHLKYHLATIEVLTPQQNRRYGELRGYADGPARTDGGHHHHRRH